jgi:hypothetical protein
VEKISSIVLAVLVPVVFFLAFCVYHMRVQQQERIPVQNERLAIPKDPPEQLYPTVTIAEIAAGKWIRPRAQISGTVDEARNEADGDFHFRVTDGKEFVICEITPQQPHLHPKVGMKVTVGGVVRYDGEHKWWELHPVDAWTETK